MCLPLCHAGVLYNRHTKAPVLCAPREHAREFALSLCNVKLSVAQKPLERVLVWLAVWAAPQALLQLIQCLCRAVWARGALLRTTTHLSLVGGVAPWQCCKLIGRRWLCTCPYTASAVADPWCKQAVGGGRAVGYWKHAHAKLLAHLECMHNRNGTPR